jgi:hypothetical protein
MIQSAGWKGGQHLMARAYSLVCGLALLRARGHQLQKKPADNGNGIGRLFNFAQQQFMWRDVRFGSKADIALGPHHVRFTPKSGHR